MPTYTYKCDKCDHEQDEFHSFSVQPQVKCEVCGENCAKQFSASGGFILKGGGFPSQEFKLKDHMTAKNKKMKAKMVERENSGEGITKLSNLA